MISAATAAPDQINQAKLEGRRVIAVGDGVTQVYGLSNAMAGEMIEYESGAIGQGPLSHRKELPPPPPPADTTRTRRSARRRVWGKLTFSKRCGLKH